MMALWTRWADVSSKGNGGRFPKLCFVRFVFVTFRVNSWIVSNLASTIHENTTNSANFMARTAVPPSPS